MRLWSAVSGKKAKKHQNVAVSGSAEKRSKNCFRWVTPIKLASDSDKIAGRYGHSGTYDEETNSVVVFGGTNQVEFSAELFRFHLDVNSWELLVDTDSLEDDGEEGDEVPTRRNLHSAVKIGRKLYIFGGKSNGYFNDMWCFHLDDLLWTKVKFLNSEVPDKRYGQTAVVYDSAIWVFGGYDSSSFTCNDLWKFEFKKGKKGKEREDAVDQGVWTKIVGGKKEKRPESRYFHTSVVVGDQMIVFGGLGDNGPLGDLWCFNFLNNSWHDLSGVTDGKFPCNRYGHSCVALGDSLDMSLSQSQCSSVLMFFGGYDRKSEFSDLHALDVEKGQWHTLSTQGEQPAGLFFHCLCLVGKNKLWCFGGRDANFTCSNGVNMVDVSSFSTSQNTPILMSSCVDDTLSKNADLSQVLPSELIVFIFSFLSAECLLRAGMCCRHWHYISQEDSLWRYLYQLQTATDVSFSLKATPVNKLSDGKAQKKLIDHLSSTELRFLPVPVDYNTMHQNPKTLDIKLVVVGDGATGKTCTLIRICQGTFPTEYVPTVFDNYWCGYSIQVPRGAENTTGYYASVGWWDTAGPEDYDRLRPLSYPHTSVFLVVYSVCNPASYENIRCKWFPEIHHFCPEARVILGACKSDLIGDKSMQEKLQSKQQDFITTKQGWELANEIGADDFVTYSNVTGEGIEQLTNAILSAGVRKNCDDNPRLPSFFSGSSQMRSQSSYCVLC